MDGFSKLLVLLGLKERPPWVDARGVVHWGRMDADFRSKCVVWVDGRTVIAQGYTGDAHVHEVLRELRDTGIVPGELRQKRGTVEEVAAAWRGGAASRGSRMANERLVEKLYGILEEAVEAEADDVFFEMGESDCQVLVLVNNSKLPLGTPLTKADGDWMIHYLFYCKTEGSKLVSFIKSEQQGWGLGRDDMRLPEKIAGLRCESGPNVVSDHLVVRIFPKNRITEETTLEKLGHRGEVLEILREIRMSKYGAVIIAGPTGEGKSTTNTVNMMTQMKEHDYRLNMVTVDDPVENRIPKATQIQVPSGGIGDERVDVFAKVLRHFVRIHPQVGGIGEIRDLETAKQVLQFVDSGHQIYTTLHAHNANGIPFRLLDMGVETAQLVKPGNIRLFMNQRLMSIVCPECCRGEPAGDRRLPAELEAMFGAEVRYRNPEGCGTCLRERRTELAKTAWAGYSNRLAFAEWIRPDDGYLAFVRNRDALGAWRYWLEHMGGVTLGAKIWRAVGDGLVDPFDALAKGAQIAEAQEVFRQRRPKLSVIADETGAGVVSLLDAIGRPGTARTRGERFLEGAVVRIVRLRAASTRRRVVVWNVMRRTLESEFSIREAIETAIEGAPKDKARLFMLRRWQFAYADGNLAFATEVARWVPASEGMILGALAEGNAQTVVAAAARVAEVTRTMTRAVVNALLMPCGTLLLALAGLWWAGGDLLPKFREMSDPEKWSTGAQLGYWLATTVHRYDLAVAACVLALVVGGWLAVLRWTGAGRRAMDDYVPFSLYRVVSGSAFLMMVVELMKLGVDLNDETWERLSERASPYVRSRIEGIQERMVHGGMGVGLAMREAGTGFPDHELVAVAAAFDGRPGWHEEMSLFLERWVRDSEEAVKLAAAGVSVFLITMTVLLAALMLSPMFQSTIHLKNLGS